LRKQTAEGGLSGEPYQSLYPMSHSWGLGIVSMGCLIPVIEGRKEYSIKTYLVLGF